MKRKDHRFFRWSLLLQKAMEKKQAVPAARALFLFAKKRKRATAVARYGVALFTDEKRGKIEASLTKEKGVLLRDQEEGSGWRSHL